MSIGALEPLVLASASAARRRILEAAGIPVIVDPATIDESAVKLASRREGASAATCAAALAQAKAARVSARHPGVLVIGADQILECDGAWLDKAHDLAEAHHQLETLRGRWHGLVSAVAVMLDGVVLWHEVEHARLAMRRFSDAFLADYVAAMGETLLETVGGYALEGPGVQLFARVEGDHFAILGLPLLRLLEFLRGRGAIRQ